MSDSQNPIRLGIIGAGLFAREAHLPALQLLDTTFEIAAICTRSPATAYDFTALLSHEVDVYHDIGALLARDDIDAVDILLPINVMPDVVRQALAAGKHVISEKPIAATLAQGRALVDFYNQNHSHQIWMVAENWRYAPTMVRAADLVQLGALGKVMMCSWAVHVGLTPTNQYYQTSWRRDNSHPGGFLLDGGIHFVAALRKVLGEISRVSAYAVQMREDLPPLDTLSAALEFDSGVIGTLAITYAAGVPWVTSLTIVGDRGVLEVNNNALKLTVNGEVREEIATTGRAIDAEFGAFAEAIRGEEDHYNTPIEALQDVAVLEALLQSAERGERITPQRLID